MGLLEFNKLPINTLVGADWKTFKAITGKGKLIRHIPRKILFDESSMPFTFYLGSLQEKRNTETVGRQTFWNTIRSFILRTLAGLPLLHNVFSCDKHFGYNTTYQTVFHLRCGDSLFKKNMGWLMPDKRPTDNMELAQTYLRRKSLYWPI